MVKVVKTDNNKFLGYMISTSYEANVCALLVYYSNPALQIILHWMKA